MNKEKVKVAHTALQSDERRVPELIPVLGRQLAGGVSHKPGGRLVSVFWFLFSRSSRLP